MSEPVVDTASGAVLGSTIETPHGPVHRFAGIPFGAPPIGDGRFRAAEPFPAWSGVRPAREFGPSPMQAVDGPFGGLVPGMAVTAVDEDCLSLNVWLPAGTTTEPRAVMVWIYGGAFVTGGSGTGDLRGRPAVRGAGRRRGLGQLPRRRARLPRSPVGAGRCVDRHQLRLARSAARPAVGATPHRPVRRGSRTRHRVRRVSRSRVDHAPADDRRDRNARARRDRPEPRDRLHPDAPSSPPPSPARSSTRGRRRDGRRAARAADRRVSWRSSSRSPGTCCSTSARWCSTRWSTTISSPRRRRWRSPPAPRPTSPC